MSILDMYSFPVFSSSQRNEILQKKLVNTSASRLRTQRLNFFLTFQAFIHIITSFLLNVCCEIILPRIDIFTAIKNPIEQDTQCRCVLVTIRTLFFIQPFIASCKNRKVNSLKTHSQKAIM